MNQRKKIIKIASRLISKNGYKGTSLKHISDLVGIHQSTLFHYFKNKEAILLAVIDIAYEELLKNINMIIENRDISPEEKLKLAISNHIILLEKHFSNVNVLISETGYLSTKNQKKILKIRKNYTECIKRIVDEIKKTDKGYFKGMDTSIVAYGILGMCIWVGRWYKKGYAFKPEQISHIFYRMLTQGKDH
ncbi:MAG: TetR/AcrR family transcriptional regulator [Thermodesulfobacteriota bacterium]|nr:TetR/AcrR family transcriptional regulator [Thermodesulfobacteriota bacterium]